MALYKNVKYPNGVETNYHKITQVMILASEKHLMINEQIQTVAGYNATIVVNSYVSNTVRTTSVDNYVVQKTYSFNLSTESVHENCIMHLSYDLLKTLPEFTDAEDV